MRKLLKKSVEMATGKDDLKNALSQIDQIITDAQALFMQAMNRMHEAIISGEISTDELLETLRKLKENDVEWGE